MSEDGLSLTTFATGGFLIASILIFSLVALPELMPTVYPQLRHGTVEIRALSTSGLLLGPFVSNMEVTINSIAVHRIGVGEGAWVTVVDTPTRLDPLELAKTPVILKEAKIPIGDYNFLKLAFGEVTATTRGQNVTLKVPTQESKISIALTVSEGKHSNLIIDLSFNEAGVAVFGRFEALVTATVEQPGHAPLMTVAKLKTIASVGPWTLSPGESRSSTFSVEPGSAVENYLVHVDGGSGVRNAFELEIIETGEIWYDLTGSLWFLGGSLAAGTYTMNVSASSFATTRVVFTVNLYRVPRITADMPDAAFSGLVLAGSSPTIGVNEFALYIDQPGLYDFYLGVKSGDYEFLIDNNPASVASKDQVVTFQLNGGLHTFQIFTDFSGSGRDTSWSVGVVPLASEPTEPLSREATLATGLLLVAVTLFVADVGLHRLRRKLRKPLVSETAAYPETTPHPFNLQREPAR